MNDKMREAIEEKLRALNAVWAADGGPFDSGWIADVLTEVNAALTGTEQEAGAWQPIETAPKDGTKVDLWSPRLGRMADFHWQTFKPFGEPGFKNWAGPANFGPLHSQYPVHRFPDAQPTHWMHIPKAPVYAAPPAPDSGT